MEDEKMNSIKAKLIVKQSQVDRDLDKAIKVIEPLVTSGKKITKREIDKMQIALNEVFGTRPISEDAEGKHYSIVHVWLKKDYFTTVNLMHRKRSIQEKNLTSYISNYTREIYLNRETGAVEDMDNKNLDRYLRNNPVLTEKQAQTMIDKYERLEQKIRALQSQQSSINYYYMMK